jgi:hypothetical protein
MSRIRSRLANAIACAVAAATLVVAPASPAAAFGDETFGCRIAPGTVFTWNEFCANSAPASTYNVGFAVFNTSGSYTYSWTITGDYRSIITGCTPTSYDCAVSVRRGVSDQWVTGTVTYTQNGQSATQTAYAIVMPYCGNLLC